MATLEWMVKLQVFSAMRESALPKVEPDTTEDDLLMLARIKAIRLALNLDEEVPPEKGPMKKRQKLLQGGRHTRSNFNRP